MSLYLVLGDRMSLHKVWGDKMSLYKGGRGIKYHCELYQEWVDSRYEGIQCHCYHGTVYRRDTMSLYRLGGGVTM